MIVGRLSFPFPLFCCVIISVNMVLLRVIAFNVKNIIKIPHFPTHNRNQHHRWSGTCTSHVTVHANANANAALNYSGIARDVSGYALNDFIEARNWDVVRLLWHRLVTAADPSIPTATCNPLFLDSDAYVPTTVREIESVGVREFNSKNSRYYRMFTYGIRIGYVGYHYQGYQWQPTSNTTTTAAAVGTCSQAVRTVEGDMKAGFKQQLTCAGRTDKDVSSMGQVLTFKSTTPFTQAELLERVARVPGVKEGNIVCYECGRVPKKFNPRSSAVWRKYVYLFPLRRIKTSYDVDVDLITSIFNRLDGKTLPFNAFAHGENRVTGEGLLDHCQILQTRVRTFENAASLLNSGDLVSTASNTAAAMTNLHNDTLNTPILLIEIVGNRFLRQMIRKLVATAIREASIFPLSMTGNDDTVAQAAPNKNVLVDVCLSGRRDLVAPPIRGDGLCLVGVGYDTYDLSIYDFMPKAERLLVDREFGKGYSEAAVM